MSYTARSVSTCTWTEHYLIKDAIYLLPLRPSFLYGRASHSGIVYLNSFPPNYDITSTEALN
jgi:hypothetical protein